MFSRPEVNYDIQFILPKLEVDWEGDLKRWRIFYAFVFVFCAAFSWPFLGFRLKGRNNSLHVSLPFKQSDCWNIVLLVLGFQRLRKKKKHKSDWLRLLKPAVIVLWPFYLFLFLALLPNWTRMYTSNIERMITEKMIIFSLFLNYGFPSASLKTNGHLELVTSILSRFSAFCTHLASCLNGRSKIFDRALFVRQCAQMNLSLRAHRVVGTKKIRLIGGNFSWEWNIVNWHCHFVRAYYHDS